MPSRDGIWIMRLSYLKQDYFNFKKYVNSEYPPRHMDFINNDCAPDLMRFLQIKIGGRKTGCYYAFLQGIEEENLPVFSDDQIEARYLLTTGFMERMLRLRDLYNGKSIRFCFEQNHLLLAIPNGRDMFEAASFFRSNMNKAKIDVVFE